MEEKNFGFLGQEFQQLLLKTLIEDKKFASTIIDVLEPKYFDGPYFKYLITNIIELHNKHKIIPDYVNIRHKIITENLPDSKIHIDTLKTIEEKPYPSVMFHEQLKGTAMNFCKQQVLKKEIKKIQTIIDGGEFEQYEKIEGMIQQAMLVGADSHDVKDVFEDVRDVLKNVVRKPVPTGIEGLDKLFKGGLSVGELGVILAPTGVGKTTMVTKFANSAYEAGFNVLQIFFEDNMETIARKHYTIWTKVAPDDQPEQAEEIAEFLEQKSSEKNNRLKLLKMPSDSVTVSSIKSKLRKLIAEGFIPDIIFIDYVDCIVSERNVFGEEWKGDASIMRSLESMTNEFNVPMWIATQGNRDSISSEVVLTDQMGGSIKKAQIGHVVISIGKTFEQKENKLATITLLKSRIGPDGIVFSNCIFDNEFLIINTESQSTILGHKQEVAEKNAKKVQDVYQSFKKKRQKEIEKENKENEIIKDKNEETNG